MSASNTDDFSLLDRPVVLSRLFYPLKEVPGVPITPKALTYFVIHRILPFMVLLLYSSQYFSSACSALLGFSMGCYNDRGMGKR